MKGNKQKKMLAHVFFFIIYIKLSAVLIVVQFVLQDAEQIKTKQTV